MSNQGRCCIVDNILDHRQNTQGRFQFLIKWKKSIPTWQPLRNLIEVQDLIEKYLQNYNKANKNDWSKRKIQILNSKMINNTQIKGEGDQINSFSNVKRLQQNQIIEQNLQTVKNQYNKQGQYILRYDNFYQRQNQQISNRYRTKKTVDFQFYQKKQQFIEWTSIKRALQIKKDQMNNKWIVLIEWYDKYKQNTWIDKDILRLTNPFVLYEFYVKIQRQRNHKNKNKIDANNLDQYYRQSEQIMMKKQRKVKINSIIDLEESLDTQPNQLSIHNLVIQID